MGPDFYYPGIHALKNLSNTNYSMYAGDANADGNINDLDSTDAWINEMGLTGYLQSDVNLDIQVDNKDKNDLWYPNAGKSEMLPE